MRKNRCARFGLRAEHFDAAGGRPEQTDQAVHGRAFAGAILSEQREEISFAHFKIDAVERGQRPTEAPATKADGETFSTNCHIPFIQNSRLSSCMTSASVFCSYPPCANRVLMAD